MNVKKIISGVAWGFVAAASVVTYRGLNAAIVPYASQMKAIQDAADRGQPIVDRCVALANEAIIPDALVKAIRAGMGDRDIFATSQQVETCVHAANRTASANLIRTQSGGAQAEERSSQDNFRLFSIKRMHQATQELERPINVTVGRVRLFSLQN